MADKYLIFGATYNGDGTSSAEAASNGAAGAWNQDTILTGTAPAYGTLAAGDTVYIRAKTGNGANANISKTLVASTTLGNAAATVALPITWILDNGDKWSGVDGTLTYTTSSTSYTMTLRNHNRFISKTKHAWIIENTATVPAGTFFVMQNCETKGLKYSAPNKNANGATYGGISTDGGLHTDFGVLHRQMVNAAGNYSLFSAPAAVTMSFETRWVNPEIELTTPGYGAIWGGGSYFYRQMVHGGRIYGAGATTGVSVFLPGSAIGNGHKLEAVGLDVPKQMGIAIRRCYGDNAVRLFGLDGGSGGEIADTWGNADCRNYTANYPKLNGTLADSASTGVTWRVVPQYSSWSQPVCISVSKLYTSTAASKKVTLELLISNTWGAGVINRQSLWMAVSYIDNASGELKTEATRLDVPGTDLTTSTAAWDTVSWGVINFVKRKLELTTAYSIKQDTAVTVTVFCTATAVSIVYDQFMFDPDVQLTTP